LLCGPLRQLVLRPKLLPQALLRLQALLPQTEALLPPVVLRPVVLCPKLL
jgi:hypothetical protein